MLHHDAPRLVPPVPIRQARAADLPAIVETDARAFGLTYTDQDREEIERLLDLDRFLVADDAGEVVGVTASFPFEVTLPGGSLLPAAGVTWVAVAVTHRRRGILRALLAEQHGRFTADGLAVSLLTASEGAIYGRFGYGIATENRTVEIERRRAVLRPDVPDPRGVRHVDTDGLRRIAPGIHRRWAAQTPGGLSRSDGWWDHLLTDTPSRRGGASGLFHLAHPDGYVTYRIDGGACRVLELVTATDEAYMALWRTLLALDLVDTIHCRRFAADEPLPHLLTDPRTVRTVEMRDGVWARILDVPAALAARRYATELDVVLDVHDPFLDAGGRVRLRGGPEGAECVRLDGNADGGAPAVGIGIAALGSLLVGGASAGSLARAGLVETADPALLRRVDTAFRGERTPQHGTEF